MAVPPDYADLYEHAPCGHLSTLVDGTIVRVNTTLLRWLGHEQVEPIRGLRLADLLTSASRIHHESHLVPVLHLRREVSGMSLDLRAADGSRIPVLAAAALRPATPDAPALVQYTMLDVGDRRAYERELMRDRDRAEREQERLRQLVAGLQLSLLPASLPAPPGMRTAAHYHMASADEVGGDFYDLFPLGDGRWGFFLGDVCGKGIDAAATTATARYTLRAAAVYDSDPATALANLNTVLFQEYASERHRHCTVLFGVLTPTRTGYTATIAGGGHPAPLLLRADGSTAYQPMTGGTLIGILPSARIATRTVVLDPGDTLVLYTDGLTEARIDGSGNRYGNTALLEFAHTLAPCTATRAVDSLTKLITDLPHGLDDDVAFMALQVDPSA